MQNTDFFYVDCKTLEVGIECAFEEYMFNFTLLHRADELNLRVYEQEYNLVITDVSLTNCVIILDL